MAELVRLDSDAEDLALVDVHARRLGNLGGKWER